VLSATNFEFIRRMAEIALLGDLWQARFPTPGKAARAARVFSGC